MHVYRPLERDSPSARNKKRSKKTGRHLLWQHDRSNAPRKIPMNSRQKRTREHLYRQVCSRFLRSEKRFVFWFKEFQRILPGLTMPGVSQPFTNMPITVICSHRGCSNPQPCKDHQRSPSRAGYNTTRWRKFRLSFLRANPLCSGKWSACEKRNRVTAATDVDHERRVTGPDDPSFFAGPFNALCHTCHLSKTVAEQKNY